MKILFGLVAALGLQAGSAMADSDAFGISDAEYRLSCASCHGIKGKGDGPMAQYMKISPADLTQISKNNGGDFPFIRVMEVIDGRGLVAAHGPRDMPVWGARLAAASDKQGFERDLAVRAHLLELMFFVLSIQEK
ncbi:MAG: cytochrome c [Notoacmeibacter sp.]|nr:cytochrome c [Notoacmeibacter sp.]MCC0033409.1 cytochrome c [Brucellaceae bacterium]